MTPREGQGGARVRGEGEGERLHLAERLSDDISFAYVHSLKSGGRSLFDCRAVFFLTTTYF